MIEIKKLEDFTGLNKPARMMKYVLGYCSAGSFTMTIDEKDFKITAGQAVTITSGQVHSYHKFSKVKGFILEFTLDFFCKNDNDVELIFHNGLFCHFAMNEVIAVDKTTVETQLKLIKKSALSVSHLRTQPDRADSCCNKQGQNSAGRRDMETRCIVFKIFRGRAE